MENCVINQQFWCEKLRIRPVCLAYEIFFLNRFQLAIILCFAFTIILCFAF